MAENENSFFGKCRLDKVANFYKNPARNDADGIATNGVVEAQKVQVIHYPDCQQLVFHMPKYAYDAGSYQLINNLTGTIIEDLQVKDRLNGGTMMLIDTLPYAPGSYTIKASWPDGWTHQIQFTKFEEGFCNNPEGNLTPSNEYLSNKGPEPDMQHSDETVTYTQNGRGGKISYRNGGIAIDFDWEFADGNAVVLFFVPEKKYWEAQTNTPVERREEILAFVANRVIEDQAPGCRFEIYSDHISILR